MGKIEIAFGWGREQVVVVVDAVVVDEGDKSLAALVAS